MQFCNLKLKINNIFESKLAMISCAESCTGGMLAGALTDLPGSSAVFDRGFVTYSNKAKIEMLGVREKTLVKYGAVSEEVAREMARGALHRSLASLAISITGIAGPGGSDFKPEGRVCFALALKNYRHIEQTLDFGAIGRTKVREASCKFALEMIIKEGQTL